MASICRKQVLAKLNELARTMHYMNNNQRWIITKPFVCSQFGYYTRRWMFHRTKFEQSYRRCIRVSLTQKGLLTSFASVTSMNQPKAF